MAVLEKTLDKKEFETDIEQFNELVNVGFTLHGHICPAMPLGLRAGLVALKKLQVGRSRNKELRMLVENGPSHAALCFSEGLQVATSCTFGKGNATRTNESKNAFTLIDTKTNKAVRVSLKYEFFDKMLNSEFVLKRKDGIEPYDIDESLPLTAIQNMLKAPDEKIFTISDVIDVPATKKSGTFSYRQCEECKEPVFESGLRKKGDKLLCQRCSGY